MDGLIRKKDLVETVGVAKSTIADWVVEFHVFIPTVKHGAVTYYRPEAIDVLNYIKELRSRDYAKPQIIERLTKEGYPITVEEAVEDVQRVLSRANARDTLLNVMQTLGITVGEIGKQAEHLTKQDKKLDSHENRIEEQGNKVDELEKTVEELKRQLAVVAKQQKKKSLWRKLINH